MSQENVGLVRSIVEAWNRGDPAQARRFLEVSITSVRVPSVTSVRRTRQLAPSGSRGTPPATTSAATPQHGLSVSNTDAISRA